MSLTTPILIKVFAVEFYRRNVFLFMLLILFAAGFMRGADHIALASYFTSSLFFLIIPAAIWTIYLLIILNFNGEALKHPANAFLAPFVLLSTREQWAAALGASAVQQSPAILYGIFLILVSFRNTAAISAFVIVVILLGQLFLATSVLRAKLVQPDFEHRTGMVMRWISMNLVRPFIVFCVEWPMGREPLAMMGLKISGTTLILAALYLYGTETYDIRLAGIAVTFAFALNAAFVLSVHHFMNGHFLLYQQSPFTILQRYGHIVLSLAVFTTPELLVMSRNIPESLDFFQTVWLYSLGLSMNVLMYTYLYTRRSTPERPMPALYTYIVFTFFCVLSAVPIAWIVIGNIVASLSLLHLFYYRYEPS